MANEIPVKGLPEGITRIIIWRDRSQVDRIAMLRGDPNKGKPWILSGHKDRKTSNDISLAIGGQSTVILVPEDSASRGPQTPEAWDEAFRSAHIKVTATTDGWKASVITPGVTWMGHVDIVRYSRGNVYSTHYHRLRDKAIKRAERSLDFVRGYFERSKQNGVVS
jgi:hypothetical protein